MVIIIANNFQEAPTTITELMQNDFTPLPVFLLRTTTKLYKANTLDDLLRLWKKEDDQEEVLHLQRLG